MVINDETIAKVLEDREAFAALSRADRDAIESHLDAKLSAKLSAMDKAQLRVFLTDLQDFLASLEGNK